MRTKGAVASALTLLTACSSADVPAGDGSYTGDASYRRSELVASLVNPANGYSALRLAHYDTGEAGDWSELPEWNPRAESLAPAELSGTGVIASAELSPAATARDLDADLLALGEDAFFTYPTQLAPEAATAVRSSGAAAAYGLWSDERRGVGGLVRTELPDGTRGLAFTCSTCHTRAGSAASSGLLVGAGNDALDVGAMLASDASFAWGPGRVDVTTTDGSEPVRIPDLRPVRWLTYLQQDATVRQRDLDTLAIRIETLILTSNNAAVRPPRRIALALATYLWSLGSSVPASDLASAPEQTGEAIFAGQCRRCHDGEGLTGTPVPLAEVGTDPTIGRSKDRGTGRYRVPSLRGVGSRGMLLHDASIPSVAALFDPARTSASFTGGRRGPGAVPGHPFGLDLDDASRAALVSYVSGR
jgi:mono/diheme cytochrome c family protein